MYLTSIVGVSLCNGFIIWQVARVESFSPPLANEPYQRPPLLAANGLKPEYGDAKNAEDGNDHSIIASESTDIDISGIEEAQLLLACRAYLLRKHKLEWKQKKRRAEAAASPLFNEGYFWPDPNDLVYLREDPDPENLVYNETYAENYGYKRNGVRFLASEDTTYSGKNYYVDEPLEPEIERASTSTNPFSTNPLYPSEEHLRRSTAKIRLWNNQTWKEEWHERRWGGKVATRKQKLHERQAKKLRDIPNDVIESTSFDEMSEEEVAEAIVTYLNANRRKSESRKSNKDKRQIERESFREWRKQVKEDALKSNITELNISMRDVGRKVVPPSDDDVLSFTPSAETMQKLRSQRSEKSRRAFQTRLANSEANTSSSLSEKITKLRRSYDQGERDSSDGQEIISPMQAILHIDFALDHNKIPCVNDVEIILKPGRLHRRRAILRRILKECFDLRGKCVPSLSGDTSSDLLFVTKCSIEELGKFVLAKLRTVD